MKQLSKIVIILLGSCILSQSCKKKDEYPVVPYIEFMSFTKWTGGGLDTALTMKISFTDGDGDIGLSDDTMPPFNPHGRYYYNFLITYMEKKGGQWKYYLVFNNITQQYDTVNFNSRIPWLTPDGGNRAIKGEIDLMMKLLRPAEANYDTVRFDAFIYDRSFNKSNVIRTPEVIMKRR
jgi:hypothetical protein